MALLEDTGNPEQIAVHAADIDAERHRQFDGGQAGADFVPVGNGTERTSRVLFLQSQSVPWWKD